MKLRILSLRQAPIEKTVSSVSAPTPLGEITVLDNHIPLVTPLEKGNIRIREQSGKEESIEAKGGFIEVRPARPGGGPGSEVNILLD